jgi:chitin synthase
MGYLLFCSVWLTIKAVQATLANLQQHGDTLGQNFGETVSAIFRNPVFRDLIISTSATYGLYLVSSILFFDFLHMFTSFLQYLLLSPSYVNIMYFPPSRCLSRY